MSGEGARSEDAGLAAAFPSSLRAEALAAINMLPAASHRPVRQLVVLVDGERVTIPYRIYNPEPGPEAVGTLSDRQQLLLRCLLTRHHDGWVRQRNLKAVIASDEPWVIPFVVQLVGEYVIEILYVVRVRLVDLDLPGSSRRQTYGRFLAENPAFLDITSSRVTSYWSCYYRHRFLKRDERPNWKDYPGFQLIETFRRAAAASAAPLDVSGGAAE